MPSPKINIIFPSTDSHVYKGYGVPSLPHSHGDVKAHRSHQRLRSGSRTKLLYAPKPKLELSWKYTSNESFNSKVNSYNDTDSYFDLDVSVSPKYLRHRVDWSKNHHAPESEDSNQAPLKPIVINDTSKNMNGLVLTRRSYRTYDTSILADCSIIVDENANFEAEKIPFNRLHNNPQPLTTPDLRSALVAPPAISSVSKKTIKRKRHSILQEHRIGDVNVELKRRLSLYDDFSIPNQGQSNENMNRDRFMVSPKEKKHVFCKSNYSGPTLRSYTNDINKEHSDSSGIHTISKNKGNSIPSLTSNCFSLLSSLDNCGVSPSSSISSASGYFHSGSRAGPGVKFLNSGSTTPTNFGTHHALNDAISNLPVKAKFVSTETKKSSSANHYDYDIINSHKSDVAKLSKSRNDNVREVQEIFALDITAALGAKPIDIEKNHEILTLSGGCFIDHQR